MGSMCACIFVMRHLRWIYKHHCIIIVILLGISISIWAVRSQELKFAFLFYRSSSLVSLQLGRRMPCFCACFIFCNCASSFCVICVISFHLSLFCDSVLSFVCAISFVMCHASDQLPVPLCPLWGSIFSLYRSKSSINISSRAITAPGSWKRAVNILLFA